MLKKVAYTLILVVVTLLSSCIKEEYTGPENDLPTRTVLFYLAGDNNLNSIAQTTELLRQGWSYTGNRCLIYCDLEGKKPQLLSLRGGCSVTPTPYIEVLAEYPEEDSASPEVFSRVIRDVVERYPAESYGLVFSSHATGWLPKGTLSNPRVSSRTIGSDTNPGSLSTGSGEIELTDFATAIPDKQFDFIVFETCLMTGVEVAYELRNKTEYLLASSSEMLEMGYNPIYKSSLKHLFNTALTTEESLKRFAADYYSFMDRQPGVYRLATQSLIKTAHIDQLAAYMRELNTQHRLANVDDIWSIQRFDRPGLYGDTPSSPRYLDLAHYVENAFAPATDKINALLNDIIVWKVASPGYMLGSRGGFEIVRHCGLTTYVEQEHFPKINEAYHKTAWYKTIH